MVNKTDIFSALAEPTFSGGVVTNVKSAQKLMSMIVPVTTVLKKKFKR